MKVRVLVSARSQDWLGSYWIRLLDIPEGEVSKLQALAVFEMML